MLRCAINNLMIFRVAETHKVTVYECLAQPSSRSKTIVDNLSNATDDITNRVPMKLLFYVGMPVMVTRKHPKLLEADVIANGVIGSIVGMHPPPDQLESTRYSVNGIIIHRLLQHPDLLLIKLHSYQDTLITGFPARVIGLPPLHARLQLKRIPNLAQATVTVDQFAVVPAFACTTEKLQGQTCHDGVVVTPLDRRKGTPKKVGITGLTNGPTYQHEGGTANLCIWDATQAFEWVQKYISNFGGNPNDVTAVGFSAGGSQVMFQMTRFGGRATQLFHKAYIMSPGYVPGAGHHHAEQFWQNVSSSLGCDGGHLNCMREVAFDDLVNASNTIVDDYTYQMQPRVDGFIIQDTYEANLYQGHFNLSGPCVVSHELHEANSQAYSGVDTQEDVSTYLRNFFPGISDDAVETLLELYPEENYDSAGLRFADMKQSFDLTAKDIALTHALNNQTWNAEVALGAATHGVDQNYYWYSTYTLETASSSSSSDAATTETLSAGEAASVGAVTTTVNATIAVTMQKYLMSFVLTGNPNSVWPDDKIYWPLINESAEGKQIVFNDTFTIADDDLANARSLFWNKALWY